MPEKLRKTWSSLTKGEKRIVLVKDAINQILNKRVTIVKGEYCLIEDENLIKGIQLNKVLSLVKKENCKVCAKGALFLAHVDKFNRIKLSSNNIFMASNKEIKNRLKNIFSSIQLSMIEAAFELQVIDDILSLENLSNLGNRCIDFGNNYRNCESRILAIFDNIIKNKGEFIP